MAKARRKARKKAEPSSRGLSPAQIARDDAPAAVRKLAGAVEGDGAAVIGSYRDPLGGHWQLFVALPIDKVEPTPFQRDLSKPHLERLARRIDEVGRFLDPIVVVRKDDGTYWTPNGNHRLHALRELGGKSVVALLVPEAEMAYRILALNTERAHNLREKALEVIRMARDLAARDAGTESELGTIFEEPALLTLGACYERNGRFSGAVYRPVLARTEEFLSARLSKALQVREQHAARLIELDEAVVAAAAKLKERGFESPYLKNFVVARINPLRFQRPAAGAATPDFDETIDRMLASARKFDTSKVKADQLAATGGAPPEE